MRGYFTFLLGYILLGSWINQCHTKTKELKTGLPCIERKYNYDSIVCVCNATYCDDIGTIPSLPRDKILHYVSSLHGARLTYTFKDFKRFGPFLLALISPSVVTYELRPFKRFQTMKGFGGAMPDATAMNIATLSTPTQERLLRQYFGDEGIDYSFIRVPIGGTDFSTHFYTLDDCMNDTTLQRFSLSEEDIFFKIPYLKQVMNMSKQRIKLLAASWSAPLWMTKPRYSVEGKIMLDKQFYQLYADYHIKFLDEYKKHGLDFWGISAQNEPLDGNSYYLGFNSMGWTPEEQGDWIGNHFGPALKAHGYGNLEIVLLDDQRLFLPYWVIIVMKGKAKEFVSGVGVHSYTDHMALAPASLLSDTHTRFPELFILNTEGCIMHFEGGEAATLGLWDHAESYANSIIQDIDNWSTGWIDWNLALDLVGGPNWVNNTVDSPIIVNASADEFYKQPTFYAMAHFSKFVPPGSQRIDMKSPNEKGLKSVAFITPEQNIVIIILNKKDDDMMVSITAGLHGNIQLWLERHSINTVIYKQTIF